jgi:hypothetical protein
MSQIRHSQVGRPPKAGRVEPSAEAADAAEFGEVFAWSFKLPPDAPDLSWEIPFPEVVRAIQTIGGIATLAKLDRKTVYRRKIQPGSGPALLFVLGQRRGMGRPLVRHKDDRHQFNLNGMLLRMLDFIEDRKAGNDGEVARTWFDGGNSMPAFRRVKEVGRGRWNDGPRKWHRKHRAHADENLHHLTGDKLAEFAERKKLGTVYVYAPEGRCTVAMLCTALKWHRRKFYRWKKTLTCFERHLLDAALNPAEHRVRATGVGETRELRECDLVQSGEAVYRALYDRIDGG